MITLATSLLTILGLMIFEVVSSIDNAVINAEVITTMQPRARKWFLTWGLLVAVVLVRGLLPWLIVWATLPQFGPLGALTATFSADPRVHEAIEHSAPLLLAGGGTFLVFLFFHWLFLEPKHYGLPGERFFRKHGVWFYAIVSLLLLFLVKSALDKEPLLALATVAGSTVFFILHGFKENAEHEEQALMKDSTRSDISKLMYLEVIDTVFSIDGVLGAFAFTFSVPLILLGNGLGALAIRQLTISNIENIKKYKFLKNGAMYSILGLGTIMVLHSFGFHIPEYVSPLMTIVIISYFFLKSIPRKTTV